jgi:hypothetical protein
MGLLLFCPFFVVVFYCVLNFIPPKDTRAAVRVSSISCLGSLCYTLSCHPIKRDTLLSYMHVYRVGFKSGRPVIDKGNCCLTVGGFRFLDYCVKQRTLIGWGLKSFDCSFLGKSKKTRVKKKGNNRSAYIHTRRKLLRNPVKYIQVGI